MTPAIERRPWLAGLLRGEPWLVGLLGVWFVVIASAVVLGFDDLVALSQQGPETLAPSLAGLVFALLPVAVLVGAARLYAVRPALLAGTIYLALSEVVPSLLRQVVGLSFWQTDRFIDGSVNVGIGVLGLVLLLAGVFLTTSALRSVGADQRRWVLASALVASTLFIAPYAAAFVAYGQAWLDSISGNVPALVWAAATEWPELFAKAALLVFALAGVRAGLAPRPAWRLAAAGFGAWLATPVVAVLSLVATQAVPSLGGLGLIAYLLNLVARLAIPAAFLFGLGSPEGEPSWLSWARARWLAWTHAGATAG